MTRFLIGVGCLILIACFDGSAPPQQSSLTAGEWWGGFEINQNYTVMRIRFSQDGAVIKGTLAMTLPPWGRTGALNQVSFQSPNLHFEWVNNQGPLIFEGHLSGSGDLITGSVQSGSQQGTFQLVHGVILAEKIFDQYVGEYQIAPDSYVSIRRPPVGEPSAGIDYTLHDRSNPTRRWGNLFPISETTFVAGPGRWVPHPMEISASFVKNEQGEVTLKWKPTDSPEVVGKKVKHHLSDEEEVKFSNGNVTIAGTLTLPLTKGPHPAVVLISGSDGGLRGWSAFAQFFAQHGIAALSYDKRGFGASTGTIVGATIYDMAGDAAAGVRYLQKRPDIASLKVGVWAISQGGWMAPVVATTTPNVAFIILHAGPAVSPRLQARMELVSNLANLKQEELNEAVAYQNLYLDAMNSDEAYDKVQAAFEQWRNRGVRWVWNPGTKEQLRAQWTRPNVDFDPVPVLEKVKCPVLAFFGGKDGLVPPEGNVSIMETALKRAGNKDFTIKVLPGVNHSFQLPGMGSWGFQSSGKTPAGYYDVMIEWLTKRVNR
jgi:pimeloyl-ACP methyl ester carboxylesterase